MKSIFVLSYGWITPEETLLTETHSSIEKAKESGENFLAAERRFLVLSTESEPAAFYRIDRYNFDVLVSEVKL